MSTCADGQSRAPRADRAGTGKGRSPFSFTSLLETLLISAVIFLSLFYFHSCMIRSSFPAVGARRASRAGGELCLCGEEDSSALVWVMFFHQEGFICLLVCFLDGCETE